MKPAVGGLAPWRLALATLAVLVVVACRVPINNLAGVPVAQNAVPGDAGSGIAPEKPVGGPAAGSQTGVGTAERLGVLRLTIRWPEPDRPSFGAQAMPTNTQSLVLWVWSGLPSEGALVRGPQVVPRQPGAATVSVDISIPEGRNFSMQVKAFRETNPDLNMAAPIAQGSAAGLNVTWGEVVGARVVLDAMSALPSVTGLSTTFGAPGQTLSVSGLNIGTVAGATPSVVFNGATASVVVPVSSTSLQVTVPASAVTGPVSVVSDGQTATSSAIFWALGSYNVLASRASWDPSPASGRILVIGQSLTFSGSPLTYAAKSGDSLTGYGSSPSATFSVTATLDNPSAGTIPATGSFLAGNSVATCSLRGLVGTLQSTNSIALSVEDVASVTISPSSADVGGPPNLTPQYSGVVTLTGGATTSPVQFSSSEPASVSIDASSGLAQAAATTTVTQTVTVSARSPYRSLPVATASARLLAGTTSCSGVLCNATAIASGLWYDGYIDWGGDADYFRFALTSAGSITAYTSSSIDTYCEVLDSTGGLIEGDDDDGPGNQCQINRSMVAGTYYFKVRGYSSSITGSFQAVVQY